MRRALTILGVALVLGIGVTAAVALGAGGSSKDDSTSTATTSAPGKVWLCHHTGSWKHPYHLIHMSTHALAAHMRHGDVTPGAGNSCPTTQPAGTKMHDHGTGQIGNAKTKRDKPEKDDNETETETETDHD
jgi:hypothetical protein